MSTVSLAPITLTDATLTVDTDDFTAAVSEVTFEPTAQYDWVSTMRSGDRPRFKGVRWVCMIGYAQDLTPGSLTRYLLDHASERATVVFTPRLGSGGQAVAADVMLMPGQLGGGTDGVLTAQAELPMFGAPVPAAVT